MYYVNIKNTKLNNSEANAHAAMHYHNTSLMIDVIKNALLYLLLLPFVIILINHVQLL